MFVRDVPTLVAPWQNKLEPRSKKRILVPFYITLIGSVFQNFQLASSGFYSEVPSRSLPALGTTAAGNWLHTLRAADFFYAGVAFGVVETNCLQGNLAEDNNLFPRAFSQIQGGKRPWERG